MNPIAPVFSAPSDASTYADTIVTRSHQLISTGVWEGINGITLDGWLSNFVSEEERYFAACVLDSLIYRSEAQTIALMVQLFDRSIPDQNMHQCDALHPSGHEWLNYLREPLRTDTAPLVVIPVIRASDPPTKSGPLIARMLKRHLRIHDSHMIWPWRLKAWVSSHAVSNVIFVDDFMGTGRQFRKFIKHFELENSLQSLNCIYAPLVAHEKGIQHLTKTLPHLKIACAEVLSSKADFLGSHGVAASDGVNSEDKVRSFYNTILSKCPDFKNANSAGYGRLGLAFSFNHSTPNNTLPILWRKATTWKPLFTR